MGLRFSTVISTGKPAAIAPTVAALLGREVKINVKRGTSRHPKTYLLAEALGITLPHAVGLLTMLWEHTGEFTPRGDIGSLPDSAIAAAVGWHKRPATLLAALCSEKSRWIDVNQEYRYIIHDWPDHCETEVCRKLLRAKKDFLLIYGVSVTERVRESHGNPVRLTRESRASREATAMVKASEDSKEKKDDEKMHFEFDDQFVEFQRLYRLTGKGLSEPDDWIDAWGSVNGGGPWCVLDFEQRGKVLKGLQERIETHAFVGHTPGNYLRKGEWKRPLDRPAAGRPMSRAERIAKAGDDAADELIAERKARESKT